MRQGLLLSSRASCDFFRAARLRWITRFDAALSSNLAALRNSACSLSAAPALEDSRTSLICSLIAFFTDRLRRRRFASCLMLFFALLVCGIGFSWLCFLHRSTYGSAIPPATPSEREIASEPRPSGSGWHDRSLREANA